MLRLAQLSLFGLLAVLLIATTGCDESGDANVAQVDPAHDHDGDDHDGHDHDGHDHDGHDHDGHDHDGHDHDGHDHDGHDHDGHDHDGHDHGDEKGAQGGEHDHPETYDEAVTALVSMQKSISEAFAAEMPDDAHQPLHDIGHLLGDAEALIEKSDMDGDAKKKLLGAIEELLECYGAVDDKIHDDKTGKSYSEVAERIENAVSTLKAQATVSKE